jgi:hypothetical protein
MTAPEPSITLDEISEYEAWWKSGMSLSEEAFARLCAAARRGVEADAEKKEWEEVNAGWRQVASVAEKRAEKAEAERDVAYEGRKNAFTLLDAEVKLRQQTQAALAEAVRREELTSTQCRAGTHKSDGEGVRPLCWYIARKGEHDEQH